MTPPHQKRRKPSKGDWIAALLLQARCPDCGELLRSLDNCEYDHDPGLAERLGDKWEGVDSNDPLYVTIRHRDCHKAKTARENRERGKARRAGKKHRAHQRALDVGPVESSETLRKQVWPMMKTSWPKGRKLQSRPFPRKEKSK